MLAISLLVPRLNIDFDAENHACDCQGCNRNCGEAISEWSCAVEKSCGRDVSRQVTYIIRFFSQSELGWFMFSTKDEHLILTHLEWFWWDVFTI
jgi:hypothetical protein